ncbi:MAG: indole-3-glycerol phosphate synthase TrpC [Dehalococcoidia bacterium]|nr:indole-3-glycerol phosphate synthase TrpC [Dehalococcoidia bacterium]
MPNLLDPIVEAKRKEVAERKVQTPLAELEKRIAAEPMPFNFSGALWGQSMRLIAEVKKASPSKGLLMPDFDPVRLATTYARNGAAAISCLTDQHFQGTIDHLRIVKDAVKAKKVPVLRKDFVIDQYQLFEARAYGADASLLIVAILQPQELKDLMKQAKMLWLQCLVEVHTEEDLAQAVDAGAEVIGINNRDLHTFHTTLDVTERIAPKVPRGKVLVSESGISTHADVQRLSKLGVHAILVGEALVTSKDIGAKMHELVGAGVPAR